MPSVIYSIIIISIVMTNYLGAERVNDLGLSTLANALITTKIDEYIQMEMDKRNIPGISLAIVHHGEIIHGRSYGYSNIEHQVPVKLNTIFQSGSVGKQFTAMAVMILFERNVIGLEDRISTYFPDAPVQWSNITVRHLLTHTSGMTGYPDGFDFRVDYTEDDMYQIIRNISLAFQPGEQWYYSNLGYVMLGILIRRVTNQFYGDFLQQEVFRLLQMTTAQVIDENEIIPNRAAGYILVDNILQNQKWVAPSLNTMADGSLYLTIYDMIKWDAALYGNQLLKNQSSFNEMWSPVRLNNNLTYPYGFGWRLAQALNGMRIIEHGGAWQGFQSRIIRVPEDRLTILFFANLNHRNVLELAKDVLELYNPQLAIQPAENLVAPNVFR